MRRNIFVALLCLLLAFVVVSCTEPEAALPEHVHSFKEEWASDGIKHWHECECGCKSEETEHKWVSYNGKETTCKESGYNPYKTCSICGYSTRSEITGGHVLQKYSDAASGYTGDLYKCTRTGCGMIFFDENGTKVAEAYKITYTTVDEAGDDNPTTYIRSSEEADKNTEVTISGVPVKAGFTFKGWKLSGTEEDPVTTYTISAETAEDITLEAVWNDTTYNIAYANLDGAVEATGNPETYTRYADSSKNKEVVISNAPTKDGYFFKGWVLDGEKDYKALKSYTIGKDTAGDITLVAVWQKNLTLGDPISAKGDVIEIGKKDGTAITWIALDVDTENKCALLISENVLRKMSYNLNKNTSFHSSEIRKYFKSPSIDASDFLNTYGLSTKYMKKIKVKDESIEFTNITDTDNFDYLYILSKEEVTKYFGKDNVTKVAKYYDSEEAAFVATAWWLRTAGNSGVYYVNANGSIPDITADCVAGNSFGLRPAFWYTWL